jgi:hypothetical protein
MEVFVMYNKKNCKKENKTLKIIGIAGAIVGLATVIGGGIATVYYIKNKKEQEKIAKIESAEECLCDIEDDEDDCECDCYCSD